MREATKEITVTAAMTAARVGSGLLPVYATPMAAALMEETACMCIGGLPEGETTVGTRLDIQHLKPSAVGERLTCRAELIGQEGRRYVFDIKIHNSREEVVASATHVRAQVTAERFMQKLSASLTR